MNKSRRVSVILAVLTVIGYFGVSIVSASAQTVSITPTFYTQAGVIVNSGGSVVTQGYYYIQNGDVVYYYGNGTYYDNTAQIYGGHVFGSYVAVAAMIGSTPVLYNQSMQEINPSGSSLSAGYYFLQNGDTVYYYGNGTYYDNTAQVYGGQIFG